MTDGASRVIGCRSRDDADAGSSEMTELAGSSTFAVLLGRVDSESGRFATRCFSIFNDRRYVFFCRGRDRSQGKNAAAARKESLGRQFPDPDDVVPKLQRTSPVVGVRWRRTPIQLLAIGLDLQERRDGVNRQIVRRFPQRYYTARGGGEVSCRSRFASSMWTSQGTWPSTRMTLSASAVDGREVRVDHVRRLAVNRVPRGSASR